MDFQLMHPDGMNWSWPELEATPLYVRQYCWHFLCRMRAAQAERAERQQRQNKAAADGRVRIRR